MRRAAIAGVGIVVGVAAGAGGAGDQGPTDVRAPGPGGPGSVPAARAAIAPAEPAWARAWREKPPMTADETRAFMKRLASFVLDHHLKRGDSPQRGMIYGHARLGGSGDSRRFQGG